MNCLDTKARAQIIGCLVEGCSIRATVRMTGAAKNTVVKLLADIGCACAGYHNRYVRNVRVRRLQCDEVWQFVGVIEERQGRKEAGRLGRHLDVDRNRRRLKIGALLPRWRTRCRMGLRFHGGLCESNCWPRPDHHRWSQGLS